MSRKCHQCHKDIYFADTGELKSFGNCPLMREKMPDTIFKKLFSILFIIKLIKSETLYQKEELKVIEALGSFLNTKNFVFVHNYIDEVLIKELKIFSTINSFSVVLNSQQFENALDCAEEYFESKTLIVTKHNLNFTSLLLKITGPLILYWAVFIDSFDEIQEFYIPMNCDFFVIRTITNNIVISKAYNLKLGRSLSTKQVAAFERSAGVEFKNPVFIEDRVNFENVSLNTLVFLTKDQCIKTSSMLALDRMECFQHEMIEIMAEKLNFRIKIIQCPEQMYPYNYPNGSLSELFLMLQRKEADLSAASYIINNHRLQLYDFAWPTFTTRSMMYIKLKSRTSHWRAYLRPLNRRLWIILVIWIIIIGIIIPIFEIFRSGKSKLNWRLIHQATRSILVSLQIFCNQSLHNMSKWNSNRLVYVLSFFLFFVVYQAYSGGLISSLTVVTPRIPFVDLEGFFRDKTYKLMVLRNGFHNYYFKTVVIQRKNLGLVVDDENLPLFVSEAIINLCDSENLAFIELRENIVQHQLFCKIIEIPRSFLHESIGIGFPKNSPYRRFIKREIALLHSTGILQRMRTHLFSYVKVIQKDISNEDYEPVSFHQVVSLFFILLFGMMVSSGIFILEIISSQIIRHFEKMGLYRRKKMPKTRSRLNVLHVKQKLL